jgi:hypothetical protein
MRTRILVGLVLLTALVGAGTVGARGTSYVSHDKQWSIVNFVDPVLVKGQFIMGPVLIVHDSVKMARGEACTTFYRFDPAKGPGAVLVSFHCIPREAEATPTTTVKTYATDPGCRRLVEYQVAGDNEAHGVPIR